MKIKLLIGTLFMGILFLAGCSTKESEVNSFVGLRINPEVGLMVNTKNKVVEVVALNADGDILLAELDLVGMDIEDATEDIIEEAVEAGYIDVESPDTEVFVEIEGSIEVKERLHERLRNKINKYFVNKGIFGKVSEDTLEEFKEEAIELGKSRGHTKMLLLALELNTELTMDDIKDLEMNELVKLVHGIVKANEFIPIQNEEMKLQIEALKEKYAAMFAIGEELKALKASLLNEELTEEEVLAIEAEILVKRAEHDELHLEFKIELEAIKETFKEERKDMQKERKGQNSQKLEEFREKFAKDKASIKDKIKGFQGGKSR